MTNKVLALVNVKNLYYSPGWHMCAEVYPNEIVTDELDRIKSYSNIHRTVYCESVRIKFIDPTNANFSKKIEYVEFILYISLYNFDPVKGETSFILFNNGNSANFNIKSSIGSSYEKELSDSSIVTIEEILALGFKVSKDKLISIFGEELIEKFNLKPNIKEYTLFVSENNNKKHIGINVPIKLNNKQFNMILNETKTNSKFNIVKLPNVDLDETNCKVICHILRGINK